VACTIPSRTLAIRLIGKRVTTLYLQEVGKMRRTGLAAIALAAALAVACSSKPHDNTSTGTAGSDAGAVGTSGKVPASDRDFAREAATTDMVEVDLGNLAKDRAAAPDTKKFAQMMIDDHAAADTKLKDIATQQGIELPAQIDDKHADLKEKLSAKQGLEFDKAYADAMVNGHKDFVDKLESRIDKKTLSEWKAQAENKATGEKARTEAVAVAPESSDNAATMALNQWAAQTYPVAYAHLQAAKDLQAGLQKRSTN
jgi:putative membrane protein